MTADIFEKLGQFYLGRELGPDGAPQDGVLLYDSSNLTTHGVCVGMTGSGKTGLCLALLEEAAMDGIPALIVDPKGDLGNLLLTFPRLRGEDFAPWVGEEDARKAGVSTAEFAEAEARKWKDGLAQWGQDAGRIAALREKADIAIYTPGSNAGIPLSILSSFEAPGPAVAEDPELFAERVQSTATGLLGLLGIDADPLRSRESSLLSAILQDAWKRGQSPDLATLISSVQNPPFEKIGVLSVEEFYPSKQRMDLVMALNNLLASPSFAAWREGEPLDIASLLRTSEGKPRLAVLSIAHLSDAERMFFVTTLLEEVIAWMRRQPGTPSLRALLYIDEIFGYLPPVANPPSKPPLLLLLKQARAFGLGLLLATQNPADLDYKALANCGTWFIGRLQTDRDKMRVLEGLDSASAGRGTDRATLERMLNGLGKRVFLLNSVHLSEPVMFQTRWTMSYLRGPLTREQIRTLMAGSKPAAPTPSPTAAATPSPGALPSPPSAEPGVWQLVMPGASGALHACLGLRVRGTFASKRPAAEAATNVIICVPFGADNKPLWKNASVAADPGAAHPPVPHGGCLFEPPPAQALAAEAQSAWLREARTQLGEDLEVSVMKSGPVTGTPFETEADFRLRLAQAAREERDESVRKLREKFAARINTAAGRVERAREEVKRQQSQARTAQMQTAISVGTSILGALFGRKGSGIGHISRAGTAARGATRAMKESSDVGTAQERLAAAEANAASLEAELETQIAAIPSPVGAAGRPIEFLRLKLVPSTLQFESAGILWTS